MRTLLSWRNWIDAPGTIIAADSEVTGLGVANVVTPQIAEPWRATYAGATRNLRIDLGATREIGAIGVAFPRDGVQPQQHDRIRIRLGTSVVDGTDVLDTTAISADARPYGMWVYPIRAGIRPNLIWNPTGRDGVNGWTSTGETLPIQFGTAGGVIELADKAAIFAARSGSTLPSGSRMGFQFFDGGAAAVPCSPGSRVDFSALLAAAGCSVHLNLVFFGAGGAYLWETASGQSVPPRTGQWKYHSSEWRRLTMPGVIAPAGTVTAVPRVFGYSSTTVADPFVAAAEASFYVTDPAGTTPIFSGHYVGLDRNVTSLEAVAFARYVTISITSANPYLDIGRVWVGPALVPAYPPQSDGREITDPGENIRAAQTGLRFGTPGVAMRSMQVTTPLLSADEALRADTAVALARGTRQVLAVREVLRANATAMLGSFTALPAPRRILPAFSAMSYAVQEDF